MSIHSGIKRFAALALTAVGVAVLAACSGNSPSASADDNDLTVDALDAILDLDSDGAFCTSYRSAIRFVGGDEIANIVVDLAVSYADKRGHDITAFATDVIVAYVDAECAASDSTEFSMPSTVATDGPDSEPAEEYQVQADAAFEAYVNERYGSITSPPPYCMVESIPDIRSVGASCEALVGEEVVQANGYQDLDGEFGGWEPPELLVLADSSFVSWVTENFGEPDPFEPSWEASTRCTPWDGDIDPVRCWAEYGESSVVAEGFYQADVGAYGDWSPLTETTADPLPTSNLVTADGASPTGDQDSEFQAYWDSLPQRGRDAHCAQRPDLITLSDISGSRVLAGVQGSIYDDNGELLEAMLYNALDTNWDRDEIRAYVDWILDQGFCTDDDGYDVDPATGLIIQTEPTLATIATPTIPMDEWPQCPNGTDQSAYVVERGDFLSLIADEFDVTVEQLDDENADTPGYSELLVGTRVWVPCEEGPLCSEGTPQQRYEIQSGDFISRVADKNGISIEELEAANVDNPAYQDFAPGQELWLPCDGEEDSDAEHTQDDSEDVGAETDYGPGCVEGSRQGTYTIDAGDIPATVAASLDVTVDQLNEANADTPGYSSFIVGVEILVPCSDEVGS